MLILESKQKCPHSFMCPHNQDGQCFGANPEREHRFTCEYVGENGQINEHGFRLPGDLTGKMRIITE